MLMNNCNCEIRENIPSWRLFFFTLSILDGCPGLCYGNGRCTLDQNGWHCVCQVGWSGSGCNVVMEMVCADNLDNDGGMIHNSCVSVYLSHPWLPFKSIVLVCAFLFITKCQCLSVCSRQLFHWLHLKKHSVGTDPCAGCYWRQKVSVAISTIPVLVFFS